MMKLCTQTILCFALILIFANRLVGQSEPSRICDQDKRADIRVFCKDLDDFQRAVNEGRATTVDDSSGFLNKLDISHAAATNKFITATAAAVATKVALSNIASKVAATGALQDAGQARLDRQLDPSSNTSGTTSLVSRAGSAELISLALNSGVLTRSVNGTTATLSTNADQVFRLITGTDPDCTVTCRSLGWFEERVLNPTNISATLDLAQQNNTTVATSGQASGTTPIQVSSAAVPTAAGKLSGIVARYQLRNRFDPRSNEFRDNWKNAIRNSAPLRTAVIGLQVATNEVMKLLTTNATTSANPLDRAKALEAAKSDPTGQSLIDFFDTYFSGAANVALEDSKISDAILLVVPLRTVYRDAWFRALDQAAGTLFTLEYNYNRPLNQPETHDFKLILGYNFQAMGMLTLNGAVSIYGDAIPAGAKYGRVHYGQLSTEYDRALSGKNRSLQTQLSLAGYWQYQPNPSILDIPAGTVAPGTDIPIPNGTQEFVGTAGSLWVMQAKVTIKSSGGINIPIGVSWANKTDLLQGSKVGAQIGISYNFSSLAGLFGAAAGGQ
jgi:hypothetical protein